MEPLCPTLESGGQPLTQTVETPVATKTSVKRKELTILPSRTEIAVTRIHPATTADGNSAERNAAEGETTGTAAPTEGPPTSTDDEGRRVKFNMDVTAYSPTLPRPVGRNFSNVGRPTVTSGRTTTTTQNSSGVPEAPTTAATVPTATRSNRRSAPFSSRKRNTRPAPPPPAPSPLLVYSDPPPPILTPAPNPTPSSRPVVPLSTPLIWHTGDPPPALPRSLSGVLRAASPRRGPPPPTGPQAPNPLVSDFCLVAMSPPGTTTEKRSTAATPNNRSKSPLVGRQGRPTRKPNKDTTNRVSDALPVLGRTMGGNSDPVTQTTPHRSRGKKRNKMDVVCNKVNNITKTKLHTGRPLTHAAAERKPIERPWVEVPPAAPIAATVLPAVRDTRSRGGSRGPQRPRSSYDYEGFGPPGLWDTRQAHTPPERLGTANHTTIVASGSPPPSRAFSRGYGPRSAMALSPDYRTGHLQATWQQVGDVLGETAIRPSRCATPSQQQWLAAAPHHDARHTTGAPVKLEDTLMQRLQSAVEKGAPPPSFELLRFVDTQRIPQYEVDKVLPEAAVQKLRHLLEHPQNNNIHGHMNSGTHVAPSTHEVLQFTGGNTATNSAYDGIFSRQDVTQLHAIFWNHALRRLANHDQTANDDENDDPGAEPEREEEEGGVISQNGPMFPIVRRPQTTDSDVSLPYILHEGSSVGSTPPNERVTTPMGTGWVPPPLPAGATLSEISSTLHRDRPRRASNRLPTPTTTTTTPHQGLPPRYPKPVPTVGGHTVIPPQQTGDIDNTVGDAPPVSLGHFLKLQQ